MRTNTTEDLTINYWKQQLDNAMRMVEAFSEGSIRVRETQLKAANEIHKTMDSARKLLDDANSGEDLWRIQSQWFSSSLERAFALWNDLGKAAADTQSTVAKLYPLQAPLVAPVVSGLPQASKTALVLMDEAYRRWRDTTLQFYSVAKRAAEDAIEDTAELITEVDPNATGEKSSRSGTRKAKQ